MNALDLISAVTRTIGVPIFFMPVMDRCAVARAPRRQGNSVPLLTAERFRMRGRTN